MIVAVIRPAQGLIVYDPACGSGTFLVETLKYWRSFGPIAGELKVFGSEKSSRMLQIAELNLAHQPGVRLTGFLRDALATDMSDAMPIVPNTADVILTNPPFGVVIDRKHVDLDSYVAARDANGRPTDRIPSEILFIEQCLKFLKPGGWLGIVVPRSVITNSRFASARNALGELGYRGRSVTTLDMSSRMESLPPGQPTRMPDRRLLRPVGSFAPRPIGA